MHLFSLLIPVFCCSKDSYGHQSCLPVVDHFWGPYRAGGCLRKQEDEPLARQAVGRPWVFLCCIDDNRTLLKLYFLTEWDHIHQNELQFIRCLLPNMNKQTNKRCFFCFHLQSATRITETCAILSTFAHMDITDALKRPVILKAVIAAAMRSGFLVGNFFFYLLICQYFIFFLNNSIFSTLTHVFTMINITLFLS